MLGIDSKSTEARTLLEGNPSCADYGEVVYQVMRARSKLESEITVFEVNQGLDSIVNHFQNGHMKSKNFYNFIYIKESRSQSDFFSKKSMMFL